MAISVAANGGTSANDTTSVAISVGSVTAGQLVVIHAMKYSPSADAFASGDATKTAGTSTIGAISLDRQDGGDTIGGDFGYVAIWSCIVTGSGTLTITVAGALAGSFLLGAYCVANGSWDGTRLEDSDGQLLTANGTASSATPSVTTAGAALLTANLQLNSTVGTSITEPGGWSVVYENESGTDDNGSSIYQIVGAGSTSATWTHGTTHNGSAVSITAYKEAACAADTLIAQVLT